MVRNLKTANAREPRFWQEGPGPDVRSDDPVLAAHATASPRRQGSVAAIRDRFGTRTENLASVLTDVAPSPAVSPSELSNRAQNVLKELAVDLTGECPPKGQWSPPDVLLRRLTFRDLQTARNCGPQTTAEIVEWAGLQGVVIAPPPHAGKSLPGMWKDLVARCSTGEFNTAEIAAALERSARRKNTRIPVAFQEILLKALSPIGK
jgi:hypothetical protein